MRAGQLKEGRRKEGKKEGRKKGRKEKGERKEERKEGSCPCVAAGFFPDAMHLFRTSN